MNEQPKNNEHQRLGFGMVIAGWVIGLGLLAWLFSGALDRQRNPNAAVASKNSGQAVEVILVRNRHGHYVASGSINGQVVDFMVDTGASDISIPGRLADRLGLKRGAAVTYSTANGFIQAYQTVLDSVTLGDIHLSQVRASINPQMTEDNEILLGMTFLKHLEFAQSGNTLTLRQLLGS